MEEAQGTAVREGDNSGTELVSEGEEVTLRHKKQVEVNISNTNLENTTTRKTQA